MCSLSFRGRQFIGAVALFLRHEKNEDVDWGGPDTQHWDKEEQGNSLIRLYFFDRVTTDQRLECRAPVLERFPPSRLGCLQLGSPARSSDLLCGLASCFSGTEFRGRVGHRHTDPERCARHRPPPSPSSAGCSRAAMRSKGRPGGMELPHPCSISPGLSSTLQAKCRWWYPLHSCQGPRPGPHRAVRIHRHCPMQRRPLTQALFPRDPRHTEDPPLSRRSSGRSAFLEEHRVLRGLFFALVFDVLH